MRMGRVIKRGGLSDIGSARGKRDKVVNWRNHLNVRGIQGHKSQSTLTQKEFGRLFVACQARRPRELAAAREGGRAAAELPRGCDRARFARIVPRPRGKQ